MTTALRIILAVGTAVGVVVFAPLAGLMHAASALRDAFDGDEL